MAGAREPSMEDILASIKRVIAEEKEIRGVTVGSLADEEREDEDVLELDPSMEAPAAAIDLGPPLMEEEVADETRLRLEALAALAASAPPVQQANPLTNLTIRDGALDSLVTDEVASLLMLPIGLAMRQVA